MKDFAFYMKMYLLEMSAEMSISFHTGILNVITPSKVKRRAWIYITPLQTCLLCTCHVEDTPQGQEGDTETDVVLA